MNGKLKVGFSNFVQLAEPVSRTAELLISIVAQHQKIENRENTIQS